MEMLKELLVEQLKDLHNAEGQLVKALPKMAKAAHSPDLKRAIENHLKETRNQVNRIEQAFDLLGEKVGRKTCKGMTGLVEEGQEAISEGKEKDEYIADLALIAAAQRVEHYEISGYGTARTISDQLGEDNVSRLLAQNLEEEKKADELLTRVAAPLLEEFSAHGEVEDARSIGERKPAGMAGRKTHGAKRRMA